jgi:DNA uptake protein ComE-like DNA-binding protein
VDLNAAAPGEIAALPGLTPADAERVVAHRPYYSPRELLTRGIVDAAQYQQLADRVYLGPPAPPEYLNWVPPQAEGP